MGSAEGFGGVAVREIRRQAEGLFSSSAGVEKNEIHAVNSSSLAIWSKVPDSNLCREGRQPARLQVDASTDHGLGSSDSPRKLFLEAKLVSSGKRIKSNSGRAKRPVMVQTQVSKVKAELSDVNGISIFLPSSPASCSVSEKIQKGKQKNGYNCKCGDKRNSKVHKNRYDSFSLKNGLISFNSTAGGNTFCGVYGLKSDDFDITKYENELPLDELLRGRYNYTSIAEAQGEKAANSNNNLLQSVRKACSVLQDHKKIQAQKCAEIDGSCIQNVSTGLMKASSTSGQTDSNEEDSCTEKQPSSVKVKESGDEVKTSNSIADSPLFLPKDILRRLTLPPPKDLNSLLSDASKTTSSSKNCTDPRLSKPSFQRIGLPPFPWSQSFSGHNKLGADSVKSSTSRTMCHGKWCKIRNFTSLQRGSVDLELDLESLTFDQSLVPKVSLKSEHPENETAPMEQVLSSSGACSTSKVPAVLTPDEQSPTYAAAKTLYDLATHASKENFRSKVNKMLKEPPQIAIMTAQKFKSSQKSNKLFDASKSTMRPHNHVKVGDIGSPSKKLKLSTDVKSACIVRTDSIKSSIRDSNTGAVSYSMNLVNNSYMMKPPRSVDRPSSIQHKLRKVVPVKWGPPQG